jgi:hypothetical protein
MRVVLEVGGFLRPVQTVFEFQTVFNANASQRDRFIPGGSVKIETLKNRAFDDRRDDCSKTREKIVTEFTISFFLTLARNFFEQYVVIVYV